MKMSIIENEDVSYLDYELLNQEKHLLIKSASFYQNIPQKHLSLWGHIHGVYCFPTVELIDWLKEHIIQEKTIEIGAGVGSIGRSLNIPITDSCYMKSNPEVRLIYLLTRQPITEYPKDIIEIDAVNAIEKFKPEVVIGSWITHKYNKQEHWREGNQYGIDENFVLKNVKKYIMIGNESVHSKKPLLDIVHQEFKFDWLFSRSMNNQSNIIYVWEN